MGMSAQLCQAHSQLTMDVDDDIGLMYPYLILFDYLQVGRPYNQISSPSLVQGESPPSLQNKQTVMRGAVHLRLHLWVVDGVFKLVSFEA
jgi:hypothetical protein